MGKDNNYLLSSEQEIKSFLAVNTDWQCENSRFKATYKFPDFETAIAVLNKVAQVASRMDHHPRMTNTYNQLEFSLCTHSIGDKITSYDIELAKEISEIVKNT